MGTGDGPTGAAFPEPAADVRGHVSGVSGGQVAVGGRVFQIDAEEGAHVVINADTDVQILRRPSPVLRPAPAFPALIGRTAELDRITAALRAGSSVEVFGPSGIGKTVLLRAASNLPLPPSTVDGVVAVPARLGIPDTLSYLFDACYQGTRRVVPRREELVSALQGLRLLVVLDDPALGRDDVDALRQEVPSSLVLLAAHEQRVFQGVEGLALGGLTDEDGVQLIQAAAGHELTQRERDVAARVSQVLHGTPLELVRFAALVRADDADLVSVARGFGVDAQPEDLLIAVQRSVSAEEEAVLAALAAFDAPVGASPIAAFTGYPDTGALLIALSRQGLVQGDDLQGWRAREREAAPPEDRQRAASVLTTWVRHRPVPEEVAAEIPAIASALRLARQDHRWVDAVVLAAAAERPLAMVGRWVAWEDTLRAGLAAADAVGDVASGRFFTHQLAVMDDAMSGAPPISDSPPRPPAQPRRPPPPDRGPALAGATTPGQPAEASTKPWWRRAPAVLSAVLITLGLGIGATYLLGSGDGPSSGGPQSSGGPGAQVSDTHSEVQPSGSDTGAGAGGTTPPNLVAFTLADEPPELAVGEEKAFVARVWNQPNDAGTVGTSDGGVLTVSLNGRAATLVSGTPDCTSDVRTLRCTFDRLDVDDTTQFMVTLRGESAGLVALITAVEALDGSPGRSNTRPFTVTAAPCTVPDVVGVKVDDAERQLQEGGLGANPVGVEDGTASGLVITQDPPPGPVRCGTVVTIRYSTIL